MAAIDIEKFVQKLRTQALPPFGQGRCARYVRMALEAAGAQTAGHPVHAKDWGPTLARIGLRALSSEQYVPLKGGVVVMEGTSTSASGHIQGFDGRQWISDFVQPAFWPGPSYRKEEPAYVVYRP